MSLKILFNNVNTPLCMRLQNVLSIRSFTFGRTNKQGVASNDGKSILETAEEVPIFETEEEKQTIDIITKRNKSRLNPSHRNILFEKRPYDKPLEWFHNTVKYKKRMLGRYGMEAVEVPAGFAWPTPEEVEDMKEYERVAYPYSIQEEWARIEEKHKKEAEAIKAREDEISAKMILMEKWIADLHDRKAKKEAELLEAKKLKERLIAEVRQELGSHVPHYDETFKEALLKKEKLEKKRMKEAKLKLKEEKRALLQQSKQNAKDATASSVDEPVNETKSV